MKVCTKCGELKPLTEFTKDKSKKCGYKSACKDCLKTPARSEYMKQYREAHAEYFREKHADFRERNREKLRAKRVEYYDPEKARKYREQNKDRIDQRAKVYRTTERARALKALRKARCRAEALVGEPTITLRAVYDRDGGRCRLCGGFCDYDDFVTRDGVTIVGNSYPSIDHITPLSRGGTHTWDNVQLAHKRCNSMKSNKLDY